MWKVEKRQIFRACLPEAGSPEIASYKEGWTPPATSKRLCKSEPGFAP